MFSPLELRSRDFCFVLRLCVYEDRVLLLLARGVCSLFTFFCSFGPGVLLLRSMALGSVVASLLTSCLVFSSFVRLLVFLWDLLGWRYLELPTAKMVSFLFHFELQVLFQIALILLLCKAFDFCSALRVTQALDLPRRCFDYLLSFTSAMNLPIFWWYPTLRMSLTPIYSVSPLSFLNSTVEPSSTSMSG